MDELTSKYFEKFGDNVEFLDISGLRIKKLPSFIFENLLKLKWLDLRYLGHCFYRTEKYDHCSH